MKDNLGYQVNYKKLSPLVFLQVSSELFGFPSYNGNSFTCHLFHIYKMWGSGKFLGELFRLPSWIVRGFTHCLKHIYKFDGSTYCLNALRTVSITTLRREKLYLSLVVFYKMFDSTKWLYYLKLYPLPLAYLQVSWFNQMLECFQNYLGFQVTIGKVLPVTCVIFTKYGAQLN